MCGFLRPGPIRPDRVITDNGIWIKIKDLDTDDPVYRFSWVMLEPTEDGEWTEQPDWNSGGANYFPNDEQFAVETNNIFTLPDTIVLAKWTASEKHLVFTTPQMHLRAKTDETISIDSSGDVSVWGWNGSALYDTGEDLEVWLDWIHGDEPVTADKEVIIQYYIQSERWIIGACR